MNSLIEKLAQLSDIKVRTKIGVVSELYESIRAAQSNGYNLETIYKEIIKTLPLLKLDTFKKSLYRVSKKLPNSETVVIAPISKTENKTKRNSTLSKTAKDKEARQKTAQELFNKYR